jgi:hypothetical protein
MSNLPFGYSPQAAEGLLVKYACPTPFYVVRTRFLGNIATPSASSKPIDMLKGLWGGDLPVFKSIEALNKLLEMLFMGLWNDLTKHQNREAPFRLCRTTVAETREGLAHIGKVRGEEIGGFIAGLFDGRDRLDLPGRAAQGIDAITEMRGLLDSVVVTASNVQVPASPKDIAATLKNLRQLTRIAEREIQEIVLACTRARRKAMAAFPLPQRNVH